jgi:hypothetical protein
VKIQDSSHKANKSTVISLVAGIIALAPYLVWVFVDSLYSHKSAETMLNLIAIITANMFLPLLVIGIFAGLISLIAGMISFIDIKEGLGFRMDFRLTIIGIVLGVSGMIANVLFLCTLMFAIIAA